MDFAKVGKAAETAFTRMDSAMGNDVELDVYEKLTPDALGKLADLYGTRQIDDYIRTMENKRRVRDGKR
jgi:hypothetical protein